MNCINLKKIFFLFTIILNLIIVNVSMGQSNPISSRHANNVESNRQFLLIEQTKSPKSEPKFSWPLNSYVKAEDFIESGEPEQAIQLLEKEMSGLFPFRFPATNGYEIYFYYYKLLGNAYSAADKPVEAINAYRSALSLVQYFTITNSPIPYAKGLYGLGKQFMKIGRLTDAETTFTYILKICKNKLVEAEIYYCKCLQQKELQRFKLVEEYSEDSLKINSFDNVNVYHYAALSKYVYGSFNNAIDIWLNGLELFAYNSNMSSLTEYLDKALPYWINISDTQTEDYYNILKKILSNHNINAGNYKSYIRVMMEILKLSKLFPKFIQPDFSKYFNNSNIVDLDIKQFDNWDAKTNIAIKTYSLLDSDELEELINRAFLYECLGQYNKSVEFYENVIKMTSNSISSILVDGYPLEWIAKYKIIIISQDNIKKNKKALKGFFKYYKSCIDYFKKNNISENSKSKYFKLLLCKYNFFNNTHQNDKIISLASKIIYIYPEAVSAQKIKAKAALLQSIPCTNSVELSEAIKELITYPLYRPSIKYWYSIFILRENLDKAGTLKFTNEEKEKFIYYALNNCMFDFAAENKDYCKANFHNVNDISLFKLALKYNDSKMNKKTFNWLKRFGVIIPAKNEYSLIMANVIKIKNKYEKEY